LITYAQNFEDVILARAFGDRRDGFYIDVGACYPDDASVTKHFYDLGWSGVNVEPMEEPYLRLCRDRRRDINLQLAVTDYVGEIEIFAGPSVGESSALRHDSGARPVRVPCLTLAELCRQHADRPIDFLKIDVEGLELEVVRGGDWRVYRPRVLVVEISYPWTTNRRPDADAIGAWLGSRGYSEVYFDGLNAFFVATEASALAPLLAVPPNVLDEFQRLREVQAEASSAAANLNAQRAESAMEHDAATTRLLDEAMAGWRAAQAQAAEIERRGRAELDRITTRHSQSEQAHRATIEELLAKNQCLEAALAETVERVGAKSAEFERMDEDRRTTIDGLIAKHAHLEAVLAAAVERANAVSADAEQRLSAADHRASVAEAHARNTEELLSSVLASNSWRLAAPLRRLRAWVRSLPVLLSARSIRLAARQTCVRAIRQTLRVTKSRKSLSWIAPTIVHRFPALHERWQRASVVEPIQSTASRNAPVPFESALRSVQTSLDPVTRSDRPPSKAFPTTVPSAERLADMIRDAAARHPAC